MHQEAPNSLYSVLLSPPTRPPLPQGEKKKEKPILVLLTITITNACACGSQSAP